MKSVKKKYRLWPEIRVTSLSCPVNTAPGKIWEEIFAYVSVYHMFQFKITNFRGIFRRIIISSFNLYLLYTLSSNKMKTWFIDLHISIGVYLNDFDKSNITTLIGILLNIEKSAFFLMFHPDKKTFTNYWLRKSSYWNWINFVFCVKNTLRKCYQTS